MIINVTKDNFNKEVLESSVPVLADFWAAWCGPCKMFSPIFEEAAAELSEKAKAVKIDIDSQNELAEKYGVMSIPTFMIFKNGQPVQKSVGLISKEEILEIFKMQKDENKRNNNNRSGSSRTDIGYLCFEGNAGFCVIENRH